MSDQAILESIGAVGQAVGYLKEIRLELEKNPRTIVVLDDDPTGTQTVYDIPVITEWSYEILEKEMKRSPLFFILTNSRSLQAKDANALGKQLGERLRKIADKQGRKLVVISRGDSTLRGHYPNEVDALAAGLGWDNVKHLVVPAFFEGGRFTYNDVHYVREGDGFVPSACTPFAKDNTFGYRSSNLKEWIVEKTGGIISSEAIRSFSLDELRSGNVSKITDALDSDTNYFMANATTYIDLEALALSALKSTANIIYRTAASFVNAISGIEPRELLEKEALFIEANQNGGLVIVGSYVPKTTQQLSYLKERGHASFIALNIAKLLLDANIDNKLDAISIRIDTLLEQAETVVLYTGREVISGNTKEESLSIVNKVSNYLITITKNLKQRPRYILTKGGITSSDIAVKALSVSRANVLGQIEKGIPVWRLGEDAKFPSMPYIVFPGNVGAISTLFNVIQNLK